VLESPQSLMVTQTTEYEKVTKVWRTLCR